MTPTPIPAFFFRHPYRVEVIDWLEQGRCLYLSSFELALKSARDFLFNRRSHSRIVNHLTEAVLWEAGIERMQG